MPELSRFYGIIIKMQYFDNEKHHTPHIHAYYGESIAEISLEGDMLAGKMPIKQFRIIQAWLAIHEEELMNAWNNAVEGKKFDKIEPIK